MGAREALLDAEPHASDEMGIGEVCALLANELERIRVLGLRIEGAICAVAVQANVDERVVSELQNLDAMLQQIAALRDYTGELSRLAPVAARIGVAEALARITLGDVRARLAGEDSEFYEEGWEVL
ncbi:hypothetical protein [Candidatus Viadribacter manganicus]|uniref:PhoU domain-containing protein n=1 Tax=Candidatus Viadribacter manganicus TaxID=1759059 RepID=A0A1B1AGH8_9PROT|nr:hypothetical protein [Candidatus Viadribacter manganicus]ANP45672.1 hypothetical protein ATE48_06925 [Candidatus Viadribacter manganicus]